MILKFSTQQVKHFFLTEASCRDKLPTYNLISIFFFVAATIHSGAEVNLLASEQPPENNKAIQTFLLSQVERIEP